MFKEGMLETTAPYAVQAGEMTREELLEIFLLEGKIHTLKSDSKENES